MPSVCPFQFEQFCDFKCEVCYLAKLRVSSLEAEEEYAGQNTLKGCGILRVSTVHIHKVAQKGPANQISCQRGFL